MFKGFVRLLVVILVVSWIAAAAIDWNSWKDSQRLFVDRYIKLYTEVGNGRQYIDRSSWFVRAAEPEFLSLSSEGRISEAQEFYIERLEPMEKYYSFGHDDALKRWLTSTAALPVSEAPVRSRRREDGLHVSYRDFPIAEVSVAPRFTYVLSNNHVMVMTGVFAVSAGFLTFIVLVIGRWIFRGFYR